MKRTIIGLIGGIIGAVINTLLVGAIIGYVVEKNYFKDIKLEFGANLWTI